MPLESLPSSFSFYTSANDLSRVIEVETLADAVVVAGPKGPSAIRKLQQTGWTGRVLMDRMGYRKPDDETDAQKWIEQQQSVGVERLLTPGSYVPWNKDPNSLESLVVDELTVAHDHGAVSVLAIDHRWLTKGSSAVVEVLSAAAVPVALVLTHRGDPLSANGAVGGLLSILRGLDDVTILCCDHGAVGGLAFGAKHASIGLISSHRHLYPPGAGGGGGKRGDFTVRLFSAELLDWFTASTIAGWAAAAVPVVCNLACCEGQRLDRFLDDRLLARANLHNRTALAHVATYVVDAPAREQRRRWAELCRDAVGYYDRLGLMKVEPKGQLTEWALWA